MAKRDYYEVLGVSRDADEKDRARNGLPPESSIKSEVYRRYLAIVLFVTRMEC